MALTFVYNRRMEKSLNFTLEDLKDEVEYINAPEVGESWLVSANDSMVEKMDELGFGNCTNEKECEAVCPKGISIRNIARLNREFLRASFLSDL